MQLAAAYPGRLPVKYRGIRRVPVRRFPYSIFYYVEREHIVVLGVFHSRRDPRNWQRRME